MRTVTVDLAGRPYDILIEAGLLARAGDRLLPLASKGDGKRRMAIVTDEGAAVHLPVLMASLDAASIASEAIVLPRGEATKSWRQLEALCDRLLALGVERGDHVVALGGGVIGDLVGFACAILKRGCGFVQVPTTLLAQVDSSVGGKTAINAAAGKNLIGAFHQPALVLIDPAVLATLSPRELAAGYAEVVKYGLIDDPQFFAWCEANGAALLGGDIGLRAHAIAHSVAAKARIVAADEYETNGTRALLNLGHTFGHALEAETGFGAREGGLNHGEAVGLGCALAFRFSVAQGLCPGQDALRAERAIAAAGLPVRLEQAGGAFDAERLLAHMGQDKKAERGALTFVLARGIGRAFVAKGVDPAAVRAFLLAEGAA